jgi:hypothetical protein
MSITFTPGRRDQIKIDLTHRGMGSQVLTVGDYITYSVGGATRRGTIQEFTLGRFASGGGRSAPVGDHPLGILVTGTDNQIFHIGLSIRELKNVKIIPKRCMHCGAVTISPSEVCPECHENVMIPVVPPEYTGGSRRNRRQTNHKRTNRRRTNRRR